MVKRRWLITALVSAFLAAGCGGPTDGDGEELLVLAAASLTDVFTEIETAFEAANDGIDVSISFAGSSALREQIIGGAPAGVFASANEQTMQAVVDEGLVDGEPDVFAMNVLEIVVPAGNPGGVTGLADFDIESLLIGLCAAEVPCGDFAAQVLERADVAAAVDTYEPDVRALLTKVEAGELDAGIVYSTDVVAAGDRVTGIAIPAELNVEAAYPIAAIRDAPSPEAARRFIDYVLSSAGREILSAHGFGVP